MNTLKKETANSKESVFVSNGFLESTTISGAVFSDSAPVYNQVNLQRRK
jgi:hypothetical protein